MNIELRKISYSKSLSEETSAYTAQVLVDGVHVCDVSNHGHGGPDEQHPAKGKTRADIEALDALIKSTYPKQSYMAAGEKHEYDTDLEVVCGDLLASHLISKDLQRLLKRTVAYYDPAKKTVLTFKGKWEGEQRAHLITDLLRKKPDAKVLNNLPFAEALALFSANAA